MGNDELAGLIRQLQRTRRRLNLLLALDRLSITVAVSCTVAAAVVLTALRASPAWFSVALWLGIASLVLASLYHVSAICNAWMSPADAAREVDRRAGLEDRLATLLPLAAGACGPELAGVVLAQTLSLRDRWAIQRIAPWRPPRSSYLAMASLSVLLAASAVERRPPDHSPAITARHRPEKQRVAEQNDLARRTTSSLAANASAPAGDGRPVAEPLPPDDGTMPANIASAASRQSSQLAADAASVDDPLDPDGSSTQADPIAGRIQQLIRRAMGHPEREQPTLVRADPQLAAKGSTTRPRTAPHRKPAASAPAMRKPAATDRPVQDVANSRLFHLRPAGEGGHEAATGPGGTGDAASIFGRTEPGGPRGKARTFSLQLAGSSRVIRMRFDRREAAPQHGTALAADLAATGEQASSVDLEDVVLHRTDVPIELESALRRIFVERAGP